MTGRQLSFAPPRTARHSRYALGVVAIVFCCLLISAGVRGAPGVLLLPWQADFGWSRATVSLAAAIGIFLYGLVGPFAAALIQRFGLRRVMTVAFAMIALATFGSRFMQAPWQLVLSWGLLSGLATGCLANVLGAVVAARWFHTHRGLVLGLLTASTATGTLIFTPLLSWIVTTEGWRLVVTLIALAAALMIPVVWLLLPESPAAIGQKPYGAPPGFTPPAAAPPGSLWRNAFGGLALGLRHRTFWLLFVTFFICGFTTNGLVGTHLIAFCADHAIPETRAAGLLALMGFFDLIGTTLSGWLTDRFDSRKLLFLYYGLRGLALIYLPYSGFGLFGLAAFGVFFGLDWIATVPPTVRLATEAFGDQRMPVIFGWIVAGHQMGAASAAFLGGLTRSLEGTYVPAFLMAGLLGIGAAFISIYIGQAETRAPVAPARP